MSLTKKQIKLKRRLASMAYIKKFNKSLDGDGAFYRNPVNNLNATEGIICNSCIFFSRPATRTCRIVEGDIDPNASCRFWIIPEEQLL